MVIADAAVGWAPVYPHLMYRDPEAAINWLVRVFGFRERVRMTDPHDGKVIVAKLQPAEAGLVMVSGYCTTEGWLRERVPAFEEQPEPPWPHLGHAISVMVADVDAHHARAKAEGALILAGPKDQPWGLRSYSALDLDGRQWEFALQVRTVTPEDWGARRVR